MRMPGFFKLGLPSHLSWRDRLGFPVKQGKEGDFRIPLLLSIPGSRAGKVFVHGTYMICGKKPSRRSCLNESCRNTLPWVIGLLALQSSCGWVGPPTIVITAEEFRFTPTRIEWSSDRPLRLLIRNQGHERHVFHSQELFGTAASVTWHHSVVSLQEANAIVLEPGQWIELSFALSPGLYSFRCWVKGHAGMEGTIVVK